MEQVEDREIASKAEVEIPEIVAQKISEAKFNACVPRESKALSDSLLAELKNKIFDGSANKALMKCRPGDCAFNFLPHEVELLSKINNLEDRKKEFWQFYKNRISRKTGLQENRVRFHIRSKDQLIEDCNGPGLASVLDDRMSKSARFRLAYANYDSQMRPTTRLLQSHYFQTTDKTFCYAEALIFSDHYDDDRVEVWSLKKSNTTTKLKIQVRHRIDILNTWARRLTAKEGLAQELDKWVERQVIDAVQCLASK